MWPAKLEGEGSNLLTACEAMCGLMSELGVAIDGGKDSLSMAARVEGQVVKAPGQYGILLFTASHLIVTSSFKELIYTNLK